MSSLIKNNQLAKHYAQNLYEVVKDLKQIEALRESFKVLEESLIRDADFELLCNNKTLSTDDLETFFSKILEKAGFAEIVNNLIKVLVHNNRIYLLPKIVEAFFKIDAQMQGEIEVCVTSAHSLSAGQESSIKSALEKAFNSKVLMNLEIDASLIAGIKIKYGSLEMDASAYGRLNAMRGSLTSVIERAVVS